MLLMGLGGCGGEGRRKGDEGGVVMEDRVMVWLVGGLTI